MLCTSPSGMNSCMNRARALPGPNSTTLVTPAARQDCMQAVQSTVCWIWRASLSAPARTSNTAAPSIPLSSRTSAGTSAGRCALVKACRNRSLAPASRGVCAATAKGSIVVCSTPTAWHHGARRRVPSLCLRPTFGLHRCVGSHSPRTWQPEIREYPRSSTTSATLMCGLWPRLISTGWLGRCASSAFLGNCC